jgi:hypothetical protein
MCCRTVTFGMVPHGPDVWCEMELVSYRLDSVFLPSYRTSAFNTHNQCMNRCTVENIFSFLGTTAVQTSLSELSRPLGGPYHHETFSEYAILLSLERQISMYHLPYALLDFLSTRSPCEFAIRHCQLVASVISESEIVLSL